MKSMQNFDLMAKNYDTDKRVERAKATADKMRLYITDGHKKSAVEYGCGTGLVGFQLMDNFNTMLFIDASFGMTEEVRQKLLSLNKSENSAMCCDFTVNVPDNLKNLKVDYVFTSMALHHIKDTETILSRFYDILNNDGRLIIVELDKDDGSFHAKYSGFNGHNGFDQSELIDMAKKVGFKTAHSNTFYHDTKIENSKESPYSLFILYTEK